MSKDCATHSLPIDSTDAGYSVRDKQAEPPRVQIGRGPQAATVHRVTREELKVVAHLRDEVLSVHQLLHRTPVAARQSTGQ